MQNFVQNDLQPLPPHPPVHPAKKEAAVQPGAFKGYDSPNFVMLPRIFIRHQMQDLTEAELKVMLYIFDHTWGYSDQEGNRKYADAISRSQFLHGIRRADGSLVDRGAGVSDRSLDRALDSLVQRGYIFRHRRIAVNGRSDTNVYELNRKGRSCWSGQEQPLNRYRQVHGRRAAEAEAAHDDDEQQPQYQRPYPNLTDSDTGTGSGTGTDKPDPSHNGDRSDSRQAADNSGHHQQQQLQQQQLQPAVFDKAGDINISPEEVEVEDGRIHSQEEIYGYSYPRKFTPLPQEGGRGANLPPSTPANLRPSHPRNLPDTKDFIKQQKTKQENHTQQSGASGPGSGPKNGRFENPAAQNQEETVCVIKDTQEVNGSVQSRYRAGLRSITPPIAGLSENSQAALNPGSARATKSDPFRKSEPLTPGAPSATAAAENNRALHELTGELVRAGVSRTEALYLSSLALKNGHGTDYVNHAPGYINRHRHHNYHYHYFHYC